MSDTHILVAVIILYNRNASYFCRVLYYNLLIYSTVTAAHPELPQHRYEYRHTCNVGAQVRARRPTQHTRAGVLARHRHAA